MNHPTLAQLQTFISFANQYDEEKEPAAKRPRRA